MLTTEEKIIDWFARRRVRITTEHAKYLINLVVTEQKYGWWTVEKYKYDYQKNGYNLYFSEQVPPAKASKILETPIKQVYQFNLYKVIKPNGEVTEIYTVRDDLFRLT